MRCYRSSQLQNYVLTTLTNLSYEHFSIFFVAPEPPLMRIMKNLHNLPSTSPVLFILFLLIGCFVYFLHPPLAIYCYAQLYSLYHPDFFVVLITIC